MTASYRYLFSISPIVEVAVCYGGTLPPPPPPCLYLFETMGFLLFCRLPFAWAIAFSELLFRVGFPPLDLRIYWCELIVLLG